MYMQPSGQEKWVMFGMFFVGIFLIVAVLLDQI